MSDRSETIEDAAVEYRSERSDKAFDDYRNALILAQSTHEADDWIRAGSLFRQYCFALGFSPAPFDNPYGEP